MLPYEVPGSSGNRSLQIILYQVDPLIYGSG